MTDQQPGFWVRLKQHHIYRVAAWYGATIAVLIQVVARAFPYFGWSLAVPAVIIILIAGFPVAIVLAWLLVKPTDPASQTAWQKRRWKLGAIVTPIVIAAVVVSGIFALRFSEQRTEHLTAERTVLSPTAASATSAPVMTTAIPAQSIAVLPFVNLSGDPKQVYFSDGITEEILNALAQIPDLKVAGRTSAFQFASKDEDVRKVGAILGVATVLEGSVQKAGDEVRITAQLIDTKSGYQLWSEQYDRKLTNIFAVEDDISNAIAGKLRVQWNSAQPLVAQQAIDPRAHDFYLRGLTLLAARGPGLRDAVAAFRSAIKIDPNYADAWGALAETEMLIPQYDLDSLKAALPRAQSAAQRALALDPDTASAYVALGEVQKVQQQWPEANQSFRRALTLAPNDAEAVDQYAQFLFGIGQLGPALREIERAQALDPLSGVIGVIRGQILMSLRRYGDAKVQMDRTLHAHPDFTLAYQFATLLDIVQGRYRKAAVLARKGGHSDTQVLTRTMLELGKRDNLVREFETSPAYAATRSDKLVFAGDLAVLGQHERALTTLESITSRDGIMHPEWFWMPMFDSLRDDPRFKTVLKKIGLPYTPKDLLGT